MRSPEEVETKLTVLLNTRAKVESLQDAGTLTEDTAKEYTAVIDSTINLLEWVKGTDVEVFTELPVLDKVVALATDIDLFKVISAAD